MPFSGLVAHAGGWDELLIAVGAVLAVIVPRMIVERRRRRREQAGDEADEPEPAEEPAPR